MSYIAESETWDSGVYQIETTDPVSGGANGIDNAPHKALANRTKWLKKVADEVITARGTHASLDERLDSFDPLDTETQNAIMGAVSEAIGSAGLANRELLKDRTVRRQTGLVTLTNKGVISGCVVTRSLTATRNLSCASGVVFAKGQIFPVKAEINGAAVPSNNGASSATCYTYLYFDASGKIGFSTTELGGSVPDEGIPLYLITIPAGNTDANDPYLSNCVISSVRRIEAGYPAYFSTALYANVSLCHPVVDTNYAIWIDVVSINGSGFQRGDIVPSDRNTNGFKINYNGVADNVVIRWEISKLDQ